jgi:hypothetical protein
MDPEGPPELEEGERRASPLRPAAWLALAALFSIAVLTWKFGSRFLIQFFVSPFQFFIVVPWVFALFSIKTGTMPLKSGGKIEKTKAPAEYWRLVWFCILAGAFCFAMNLFVSWMVVSRP